MIIIRAQGGLGNQMFQYALYRKLKELGRDIRIDTNYYDEYQQHNGFELEKIFNLKIKYAKKQDIDKYIDDNMNLLSRVRRKIFGRKSTHLVEKETGFKFQEEVYLFQEGYLNGYWQTEKYFLDIREILLNEFNFNLKDEKNINLLKKIEDEETVSIHIRRGDYVSDKKAAAVHGGITTIEYYKNAIELIKTKVENPKFLIFSDDIRWVNQNLQIDDAIIVDWNKKENSYKDMCLMSKCKHNIIANSSFSWWGAWLNNNSNKIVIAPNKWFNDIEAPDILSDSWISCNNKRR